MSILWLEGFESFSGTDTSLNRTQINRKYPATFFQSGDIGNNPLFITGHDSGVALQAGRSGQLGVINLAVPSGTEFYASLSMRIDGTTLGSLVRFLSLIDSTSEQISLQLVNGSGGNWDLRINRGSGTALETTMGTPITTGTWYRIEVHVVIGNTGSWEVTLDGATVLSGTGDTQATANTSVDGISFNFTNASQSLGGPGVVAMDNIVIQDSGGAFLMSDSTGSWYIEGLVPNADTATADFALSAGTDHYALVDEVPADDDTTYLESDTSADRDLYNYTSLTGLDSNAVIAALQINTVVYSDSQDMITVISSNGTVSADAGQTPDTVYGGLARIVETDPDTGSAWAESAVNAALFGVEVA